MKASTRVIHAITQLSSICVLQTEVHKGLEEFMWSLYGDRGKMLQLSGDKYFSGSQAELQNMPPTRGTLVVAKLYHIILLKYISDYTTTSYYHFLIYTD